MLVLWLLISLYLQTLPCLYLALSIGTHTHNPLSYPELGNTSVHIFSIWKSWITIGFSYLWCDGSSWFYYDVSYVFGLLFSSAVSLLYSHIFLLVFLSVRLTVKSFWHSCCPEISPVSNLLDFLTILLQNKQGFIYTLSTLLQWPLHIYYRIPRILLFMLFDSIVSSAQSATSSELLQLPNPHSLAWTFCK